VSQIIAVVFIIVTPELASTVLKMEFWRKKDTNSNFKIISSQLSKLSLQKDVSARHHEDNNVNLFSLNI